MTAVFVIGHRTTAGLEWPGNDWSDVGIDLYRDISSAQTMVNEGYGPDPTYLGERIWYNPLTPAVSAVIAGLTGQPVPRVVTRIGTYANLLAPLTFFVMMVVLFDWWAAVFGLSAFLFLLAGHLPSYVSATYSPWFVPVNFVQAFFYLTVAAVAIALRRGRIGWYAAAGLLWGITFLGHTAPALILGGMMTVWAIRAAVGRQSPDEGRLGSGAVLARYFLMVAGAMAVGLPFIRIIAGHYGLHVQNGEPTAYSEYLLSRGLPQMIRLHLTVPMAIATLGGLVLFRRADSIPRGIVLSWIAVASGFLIYSFVRLGAKSAGVLLPSIVPSFHFFFYLKAALAVCCGVGLSTLGSLATRRWSVPQPLGLPLTSLSLTVILVAWYLPVYASRPDFEPARLDALRAMDSDMVRVANWFRAHGRPFHVVVAQDKDAATAVAVAGVKVVAVYGGFSNPYVALEPRRQARDAMFLALGRHDATTFRRLAAQYGVTHVLSHAALPPFGAGGPVGLVLRFAAGPYGIWELEPEETAKGGRPTPRRNTAQILSVVSR